MSRKIQKLSQVGPRQVGPNKDIIELTKVILKQNSKILNMNDYLLRMFSGPIMVVQHQPLNSVGK